MSMRLKRLQADYESVCTAFAEKSRIRVLKVVGEPPEKYQLEYLLSSVRKNASTEKITICSSNIVEVTLTKAYPRLAPQCRMLTPVFHPNIAPHAICIGDHWAAGESLLNLLIRIAEMLSYQSYNVKSPLNGEAAKWAQLNEDKFPLDNFDFSSILTIGEAIGRDSEGRLIAGNECANCGKGNADEKLSVCINEHTTCSDCTMTCSVCNNIMCLKCRLQKCYLCNSYTCTKCLVKCGNCEQYICSNHTSKCTICRLPCCSNCTEKCPSCGKIVCLQDIEKIIIDNTERFLCSSCAKKYH